MVLTSEELRTAALDASAKRGKSVARRRLMSRWTMWFLWSVFFPVVGLAVATATMVGLGAWLYLGSDAIYSTTQGWLKHQSPSMTRPFDGSPLKPPQLQIDRNYSNFKPSSIDNGRLAVKEAIKMTKSPGSTVSDPPKNSTAISIGQQP